MLVKSKAVYHLNSRGVKTKRQN